MKLATLKDGTRDGQLVVVSRDLHTAAIADAIAPTMQRVIEDWSFYAPQLRALYDALNAGRARRAFGFDPKHCMAPLPRAYRLMSHVADTAASSPVALRADRLLGAHDDIVVDAPDVRLDFRGVWAAILSDIALRTAPARAAESVRLLMLGSVFATPEDDTSSPRSRSRAFGTQEHCAFSPVAVTPDEIGESWQAGRLMTPVDVQVNGRRQAFALSPSAPGPASDNATAGVADLGVVAAGLVRGQSIAAGTVLLSGPASSLPAGKGASAAALASSAPESTNAWLGFGDRIRIDLLDRAGDSICGAIEQSVSPADDA